MPIRFACPHCHQKLSVAQRKAGQSADCPSCKQSLTIPSSSLESAPDPPVAASPSSVPPLGEMPTLVPGDDTFDGLELIYDNTSAQQPPHAPPSRTEVLVIPRYVVYVQGALLGGVALVAFLLGILTGASTTSSRRSSADEPLTVRGGVTTVVGPRQRPCEGAVIILLPIASQRPERQAPVAGLRPTDPLPDANHPGVTAIREMGGAYTRADTNGQFQVQAPRPGRYLALAISREKRGTTSSASRAADLRRLRLYFDDPAGLLADGRYKITSETIRGDTQLSITVE